MPVKEFDADMVGLPSFAVPAKPRRRGGRDDDVNLFDLSSHTRARQALLLGLGVDAPGFNIFVLGEASSGRMTATLDHLRAHVADRPPADDWVYLNNFRRPHKPRRLCLPAGQGRRFKAAMASLVPALRIAVRQALETPEFSARLQAERDGVDAMMQSGMDELRALAEARGLTLQFDPQGVMIGVTDEPGGVKPADSLSDEERERIGAVTEAVRERMRELGAATSAAGANAKETLLELRRQTAAQAIALPIMAIRQRFATSQPLARWLDEMQADVLEHLDYLLAHDGGDQEKPEGEAQRPAPADELADDHGRYAVNLLVDHTDDPVPPVVLEPNPTYARLFGSIEYRSISGALHTDFTMIRAGALHRANGGILVLRADDLGRDPSAWTFLKNALRDCEIRIEEPSRAGAQPMMGAPEPKPIPLDVKVVIVGSHQIYYLMFSLDSDFRNLFKVKADIDPDMPADKDNIATYARLIRDAARRDAGRGCNQRAIAFLLGQSARWAGHREKLSAQFELVDAVLTEAGANAAKRGKGPIAVADVKAAIHGRRERNAHVEDRVQEQIAAGTVKIDVTGAVVGQINALTVTGLGDHAFGRPARVTARVFVGKLGVINIERAVALGGPIQQKGVMILQGFLNGLFAQRFPLSFSCSITFEQSYAGVEGDSASLAELCAVLSALAQVPIRQDLAITGSVNQAGAAQAVGGVSHKVEGFYRSCVERGINGSQGVIVPAANAVNVTLRDEVRDRIAEGRFHLWRVDGIDEALELLTGLSPGVADADGVYPPDSLYGRVAARLAAFDRILTERAAYRE